MKILVLISYILIQFAYNQQSNKYDYNILALTYPRGYCAKGKECNKTWLHK